ncbi:hypothetical protein PISL3812_00280 [Talaromyces islandicus]|uniref:N-acetyltransferase domain-containing protein n=1 Tax=Talaromyces islandicus TaxID=28573 RepID=A0A0U1LIY7_TALIS|nr:hypothetical protein PISL3812_00280 [Talaromyces islandicus]
MHLRPYRNQDADAIAAIKARCDLVDPLALFYRRSSTNPDPDPQQKGDEKRWRTHVKSTRRSLCLEILMPGTVCWVLVLDDEDVEAENNRQNQKHGSSATTNNNETVVGFTIWSRHGSSDMARRWQGHGEKLTTRVKAFVSHLNLSIRYPFDSSIDRHRMAQFVNRLKSGPCPEPSEKERWELEAMYIHPLYQRRGFGGRALQWGVERALQERVRIWVWSTDAGKPLYLKNGFDEVGKVDFGDIIHHSEAVTVSVMVWGM